MLVDSFLLTVPEVTKFTALEHNQWLGPVSCVCALDAQCSGMLTLSPLVV
jgi:hypothetical protein